MLRKVNHPGIPAINAGKGYIGPAAIEIRKRIKSELSKEMRGAIFGDLGQSLRSGFGKK